MSEDWVSICGTGRIPDPRTDHDEDWAWFWFCGRCGVESRCSSKERAEAWALNHRCGGE